jgi:hypothetical protein
LKALARPSRSLQLWNADLFLPNQGANVNAISMLPVIACFVSNVSSTAKIEEERADLGLPDVFNVFQ